MGRIQEYDNRDYAIMIAEKTGGEFIDQEFRHKFGKVDSSYWIVIWR